MDKLIVALGPAFAAGFAVQRLLELFDSLINRGGERGKKAVTALVSLVVGVLLAAFGGLRVLQPLGFSNTAELSNIVDIAVTALVLSGGTEGFNSILKFLGYTKENMKAQAAASLKDAATDGRTTKIMNGLNAPATT